jgi:Pyrimidine dimer DNA glycosylase
VRHRSFFAAFVLAVLLGLDHAGPALAAKAIQARIEQNGKVILQGIYTGGDRADAAEIWADLGGARLKAIQEIPADPSDPQQATLTGDIRIVVSWAPNPIASAQVALVTATKSDTSSQRMRLWSIHPSFLDRTGLVALWREALLAQKVLQGRTTGYRSHPQLQRFRKSGCPVTAISAYLWEIHGEATRRGYSFNFLKIARKSLPVSLLVTQGQMDFEWQHLKQKLRSRDPAWFRAVCRRQQILPHPMFTVVSGNIEPWEVKRAPR